MRRPLRSGTVALVAVVACSGLVTAAPAQGQPAATVTSAGTAVVSVAQPGSRIRVVRSRLRAIIRALPIGRHRYGGRFDRDDQFGGWISQGNGCDTRAFVLKDESRRRITRNRYCTVLTGRWFSFYDGRFYNRASALQIDHTVPVKNAWITGAWRWTRATRVRFYNDLIDPRTLVAVDARSNLSKGDRDPTAWVPPRGRCRYVRYWAAVKTRWGLRATRGEKARLTQLARRCPNRRMTIRRAVIIFR